MPRHQHKNTNINNQENISPPEPSALLSRPLEMQYSWSISIAIMNMFRDPTGDMITYINEVWENVSSGMK